MNHKDIALSILTLSIGLALFGSGPAWAQGPSCLTPGSAAKHVKIDIKSGSDPQFEAGNACPGNASAKDGDICMAINEKPDIRFIKQGADKGDWEFVDFQLSGDGVSWPGDLPAGVYSDFQFGSDLDLLSGRPYWRLSGNSMLVQNNNCHEFTVHYRIALKNTTSGKVVRLHPVMDNTGTQ